MLSFWTFLTGATPNLGVLTVSPPWTQPITTELFLLYSRLPLIVLDVGVAWSLYLSAKYLTRSIETARLASLLWFINPFTLFTIEMLAVPDVAAVLLTMIAILFLLQRRTFFASIALGAGVVLKLYPVLLVPIFIFCVGRSSSRSKLFFIISGFLGLLGYLAWLFQGGVSLTLLVEYSPVSQPIAIPSITVGLPVGFAIITIVVYYYLMWTYANRDATRIMSVVGPALLLYFVFMSPYPQYFLWVIPFLTLELVIVNRRDLVHLITLLTIAFVWGFMTFEGYLTISGYSLLFIQLQGQALPWYSQRVLSLFSGEFQLVLQPVLKAALSAWAVIYAAEIIRRWPTRLEGYSPV